MSVIVVIGFLLPFSPVGGEADGVDDDKVTTRRMMTVVSLENAREGRNAARRPFVEALAGAIVLAERRLGRAIDRRQLAKRIGVGQSTLYDYLKGTSLPGGAVFERLLDELAVAGAERGQLTTLRDEAEIAGRIGKQPNKSGRAAPVPHQLPLTPGYFVGREDELEQVDALAAAAHGLAARVCVLEGPAGVGKTTLATQIGHRVKTLFPDGQLHADLRGFDRMKPADPAEVLLGFLHALGVPTGAMPSAVADRTAMYRSLLDGRRVLVVLDNASSSDQVRPLIPAAQTCLTVVTSRNRMDSLVTKEGATRIPLALLDSSAATDVLAARIGAARLAAEPAAVRDLVGLCAGLPLALGVVASRAADRPGESLSALVAEILRADDHLESLSFPEDGLDLRTIFRWSYDGLTPPGARLFRLLGLHPGPDIGSAACTALLGGESARPALRELTWANLLTEPVRDRFQLHHLLHAHARDLVVREDAAARRSAERQMFDHYLEAAQAANARIQPRDAEHREDVRPAPGGYADSMAWFTAEWKALFALIVRAADQEFESYAWRLAVACMVFLRRTGRHTVRIEVQRVAVRAATQIGDRPALATAQRMLADALARSGQGTEARTLLAEALTTFSDLGDGDGALRTHLSFVRALDAESAHEEALRHVEAAVSLARESGNRPALADALAANARQLTHLGQLDPALGLCEQALEIYSTIGYAEGEASLLKTVGDAELRRGRPGPAIGAYEKSVALERMLGDRYWEVAGLDRLAAAHQVAGDLEAADRVRAEADAVLDILRQHGVAAPRGRDDEP